MPQALCEFQEKVETGWASERGGPRMPGAPAELHPVMAAPYGQMVTEVARMMREDPSKRRVAHCCQTLYEWCGMLGAPAVMNHARAVVTSLTLLLQEKSVCQLNDEEDEEGGGGGGGAHAAGGGERRKLASRTTPAPSGVPTQRRPCASIGPIALMNGCGKPSASEIDVTSVSAASKRWCSTTGVSLSQT